MKCGLLLGQLRPIEQVNNVMRHAVTHHVAVIARASCEETERITPEFEQVANERQTRRAGRHTIDQASSSGSHRASNTGAEAAVLYKIG